MILDTCAVLWLVNGDRNIGRAALEEMKRAAFVYVSAVSGFEIAYKAGQGKLKIKSPPQEWFEAALEEHGLTILPLDVRTCITAAQLPPIHHDPCDRFIIATAKLNNLAVVTSDERFEEYGVRTLL